MTSTRTSQLALAALALAAVTAVPARADFIPIAQPNPAYLGNTSLLPITAPDFDAVLSLTNGTTTVSFDIALAALTVPSTWTSWGSPPDTESATPRVLWTNGFTSLELTLSQPQATFGLEAQPNVSVVSPIMAEFFSGPNLVGTITRDVDGNGGALLFAASTTTDPFDRVVLSSTDDFAIAQVRAGQSVAAVPEPGTLTLSIVALGTIITCRMRKRTTVQSR